MFLYRNCVKFLMNFFVFPKKILFLLGIICCTLMIYTSNNKKIHASIPLVINTWAFVDANVNAWHVLSNENGDVLDAVELGCITCEVEQCDGTVGYGGSPDEMGETSLDAMIMDGTTMNVGAVGALRKVKHAISVARHVLEHTKHTFLVGQQATNFAIEMGFKEQSLSTDRSKKLWEDWKTQNCQPNFWMNVLPNPELSCGPYKPTLKVKNSENHMQFDKWNHDTIGIIAIDKLGHIAVATSTNGAIHKVPGRVGDSPIVGSGGYAEKDIGGAAATGDGDIMMRFLPSFKAIEGLKQGLSPSKAAEFALSNIVRYYPKFSGGIVVASITGEFGAACSGLKSFPYTVSYGENNVGVVYKIECNNF